MYENALYDMSSLRG